MRLEDLLNKTVILELKDNTVVKGILLSVEDIYDKEYDEEDTKLTIRVNSDDYRLIYINEILTIGELI